MLDRRDFARKVIAGSFLITGIIGIFLVVWVLGVERGFNEARFPIKVLYREIGGLSVGAPVNLSGVNVGTVGSVDFLDKEIDGRGVAVTLSILKKHERQVLKANRFAIKTAGVLGEKSVEISRIADADPIDTAEPIIGEDPLDVQDLAKLFGETAVGLQETSDELHLIIREVQRMSGTTKRLLDRIERRVIDGNLFKVF